MSFLSTNRRKLTIGGIVGGLAAVGTGVAVAAILFTVNISGSTAYADQQAGFDVVAASALAPGGGVSCTAAKTGGDAAQVDAKVARVVNGEQAVIQPGSCAVKVTVKNTGQVTLRGNGFQVTAAPKGWTLSTTGTGATATVPVGGQTDYTATLNADATAEAGPLQVKLNMIAG